MSKPIIAAILPLCAVLGLSAGLAGCAADGRYPSLARRPAELDFQAPAGAGGQPAGAAGRIGGSAAPAAAAPDASARQQAVSADLTARLAQLEGAAREAHGRFMDKRARTDGLTAAARGSATASEAWAVATVAVADLESARSDAMLSLGELDRLYAEARVAAAERNDGDDGGAIAAVRDKVTAWVADEDAVLAELAGRLKG